MLAAQPASALTSLLPPVSPLQPRTPGEGRLPGTGCSSCRPSPQRPREAPLAPTCSPASWWRQHLAMLLQLPRARASLIALASLPRCQSAVPVQGHRDPKSVVWARGGLGSEVRSVRVCARVYFLLRWQRSSVIS